MKRRTIIIFSIFLGLVAIFGIFVYFYRARMEQIIQEYVAKITICGNILSEQDCYARDFCEGIYAPSCVDCQDLEFKNCQNVPLKTLIQIKKEKKFCLQTGGEWYRGKLGVFCLCQKSGIDKVWDKEKGCIKK